MIVDGYWRKELSSSRLKLNLWSFFNQVIQTKRFEHSINKEILFSAVVIRKIIEDDKIARAEIRQNKMKEPGFELVKYRVPIRTYPFIGDELWISHKVSVEDYDNESAQEIKLDLDILCNKIIHSYIWSIVYLGKKTYGVGFASDKEKVEKLYLLKMSDWIDTLQFCINEANV